MKESQSQIQGSKQGTEGIMAYSGCPAFVVCGVWTEFSGSS
jgi:hypothetical protein